MNKVEIKSEKYAELIIGISTDFLLGKINEEHYKNMVNMIVNMLLDKPDMIVKNDNNG